MKTGNQNETTIKGRRAQHRRQKRMQKLVILGVILALLVILYFLAALFFKTHFLPNTIVNGVDCSMKTISQGKTAFDTKAADYHLQLIERGDGSEEINGSDIGLSVDLGDTLDVLLEEQNEFLWITAFWDKEEEAVDAAVSYDAEKLSAVLSTLACMDESQMTDSVNASLSDYASGTGYEMVNAVHGTRINEETFSTVLDEAITNFDESVDLAEQNCYIEPVYTEDSEQAKEMLETANKYVGTTVTYTFGDQTEVLDGSTISRWILVDENLNVTLDSAQESAYIEQLADTYDTKWRSRTLTTHSGSTVTVPAGGNYGWRLNQDETLTALNGYLESGEDYTGEVVWYQTAAQYGEQDYGSTYIEVSISDQHMWYYQNGTVVLESDFVSGDVADGHDTPKGCYRIAYKARNQTLEGQGYSSPVSYWMPFVDGCGFHDASWRTSFGGSIYLTNGSHGCLNMPTWAAKELYDLIEAGTAVLIY